MVYEYDNGGNMNKILCELCGRNQGVKKVKNIWLCSSCLREYKERKQNEKEQSKRQSPTTQDQES